MGEHGAAECTDRMLIAGPSHLLRVLHDHVAHYNSGRSHQGDGLEPRRDDSPNVIALPTPAESLRPRTVLGGLINYYQRAA